MRKLIFCLLSSFVIFIANAQQTKDSLDRILNETPIELKTQEGTIYGTLAVPAMQANKKFPLALIISGSGATDRNGNNPSMKNESLRLLAHGLAQKGIASVRYDKRGIAASLAAGKNEADLRFEHYISDVKDWLKLLRADKRFTSLTVIGHSEGSLIGMIAANGLADKYISLAGFGYPAHMKLKEQMATQPPVIRDSCNKLLDMLAEGKRSDSISPFIYALFRPTIQPYLISWFQYDPRVELAKLQIPVLIVQGTTDIQVTVADAQSLEKANKKAKSMIITGMNHVLKVADADRSKNIATYYDPKLPLEESLVAGIANFIKSN